MTLKAGVVGYPIKHSLSPHIHGYWLKKYGIDGEYVALEVKPEDLKEFLNSLPNNGFNGVNLTLPHKVQALDILGNIDPFARFIGAVNTVIINQGYFLGTNTDFLGFVRSIEQAAPDFDFAKGKAVVVGAGGASRAILFALCSMKCPHIVITNRTRAKAQEIKDHIVAEYKYEAATIEIVDWSAKETALQDANMLVNTTSLGMTGQEDLVLSLEHLPKTALVTDIVYNPLLTPLLLAAQERGNTIVDGLGMLLHQAAPGFEAWFGVKPEVTSDLRKAIEKLL